MTEEEATLEARRSTAEDCGWFNEDDGITSEQNSISLVKKIYSYFKTLESCDGCKWMPKIESVDTFRKECNKCKRFYDDGWEEKGLLNAK